MNVLTPEQQWPMPIGEAVARAWVLERFQGSRSVVLAFGDVGADANTRIAPAPARVVVVLSRGHDTAASSWLGPRGQCSIAFEVPAGGRYSVEVPADTRGLWLRDDAAASGWRELPIGPDGVVRLDG